MPSDTPPALTLPARLDTDAAPALRDMLIDRRGAAIVIDASAVTRMGALCLSVLAAAARSWRSDGQALILADPSDAFLSGCTRMGIAPDLLQAEGAT